MSETMNIHRQMASVSFTRIGGEDSRTYQFKISDESRDRHGTVIKSDAWKLENYNANPIVAYMHHTSDDWWLETKADADDILGPGKAYMDGNELIGEVTFETEDINPLADKIKKKIDYGTLRATSVGFIPIKGHWGVEEDGEDTGTYYYDMVELLEFSIVNIPSNPNALMRSYSDALKKSLPPKPEIQKETSDDRDQLVRESQLFINQNFIDHV